MAQSPALRVGLIGCGFFATNHIHAWLGLEGANIAAICDTDPQRLAVAASMVGADVVRFSDAASLMASGVCDFVDIATSPSTHCALVLEAARHRMPAIVQKPMALTLADATSMVEAMNQAQVPFMVHENFRFQSPVVDVKRLIDGGRIGTPVYARIAFRTGWDIYGKQPYLAHEKRFVLADLGVHVLDLARLFMGEADRITCEADAIKPGIAGEDSAAMLLHHTEGGMSVVECTYASPLPEEIFPQVLVTVEGTAGSVVLGPNYDVSVRSGDKVERWNAEPERLPWAEAPWHVVQDSVRATQAHWLERFNSGVEPATSGRDNLNTLRLVEAAYRSFETRTSVRP